MSKCSTSAIHSTNGFLRATDTSDLSAEQTVGPREVVCSPLCWRASTGQSITMMLSRRRRTDEINGVAHTFITAGGFAAARAFYGQLLPFLGLTIVADSVNTFYCVGGRTGFGIHGAAPEFAGQRF